MAQLMRDAGTPRAWSEVWRSPERKVPNDQIELQLGHRQIDSDSDLYPPSIQSSCRPLQRR